MRKLALSLIVLFLLLASFAIAADLSEYTSPTIEFRPNSVGASHRIWFNFNNGPGKIISTEVLSGYNHCFDIYMPTYNEPVCKENQDYPKGQDCRYYFQLNQWNSDARCVLKVVYMESNDKKTKYFESYGQMHNENIKEIEDPNGYVKCYLDSDCGLSETRQYCSGSAACTETKYSKCLNPGTTSSYCSAVSGGGACTSCPNGCSNGTCLNEAKCTDSDNGKDYYTKGKASGLYSATQQQVNAEDVCTFKGSLTGSCDYSEECQLAEYYCNEGFVEATTYVCPNGCSNGACIQQTYLTEQVKCIFSGSTTEQECYSNKGTSCKGTETCVVDVKGYKGEQITWKSSCGGYAYTTIDGNNEYANFDCDTACTEEYSPVCGEVQVQCVKAPCYPVKQTFSNKCELEKAGATFLYQGECNTDDPQPCPLYSLPPPGWCKDGKEVSGGVNADGCQLPPKCIPNSQIGYKYAKWTCYDGSTESQGGESSCKSAETWKNYAESWCKKSCYGTDNKCGVNNFAVSGECGTNSKKECKSVFTYCSCSYQCIEIDSSQPRADCARACPSTEVANTQPNCGYTNGVCMDLNNQVCTSYTDENGCTHTQCSGQSETTTCPVEPTGKYVNLDEKFSLTEGSSAKVQDYGYMKLTLNYWMCTGACQDKSNCKVSCAISLAVDMPSTCEVKSYGSTPEAGCTSTGTNIALAEGDSTEAFGAKISYLAKQDNEAVIIVQKPNVVEGGVDIKIYPVENTINYGEKAVYKVTVTDKHTVSICPAGMACVVAPYTYFIDVRNLPFQKDYQKQIELGAGRSTSFELTVSPYVMEVEQAKVEETTTSPTEASSSSGGGGMGAATARAVQEVVMTKAINVETTEAVAPTAVITSTSVAETAQVEPIATEPAITVSTNTNLYRTYKFNIRAMQKNDPNNQDIAYAVLNINPETPPTPPEFPGEETAIQLYKGWNLISLPGKLIKFEKINLNQKLIGFVYLKDEQEYVSLKEAQRILGDNFAEYLARNAFWVYSYSDVSLNMKVDTQISYNDIDLKKGWNLAPITEDMIGGYLSDIKGDCTFVKLNLWDPSSQSWQKIDESYQFSEKLLNYGFLIKASEDCRLSGVEIMAPPAMPD